MKKLLLSSLLFVAMASALSAQNGVGINTDNSNPDASALLDVKSTTQGVLVPRMLDAEKTAIATPATGLLVFQTDGAAGFWYFDGTIWQPISGGGNGWELDGNTGTVNGTNFVGTTDAQSLDIRTNNVIRTRITQKGQIEVLNTGESVFIGEGAGANDDLSTNRNVFVGFQSGNFNTTGEYNVATGNQSLYSNTTGNRNIATGYQSLYSNTNGFQNVATGYQSLYANTTGIYNVATGYQSLYANTTGSRNVATGYSSLSSNTIGGNNVANGYYSLSSNTTGGYNVANGAYSLRYNTTGGYNVANGYESLISNTTGTGNVANGSGSLYENTTGGNNVANGNNSLRLNTTGIGNVANGAYSLRNNTTSSYNVANGFYSLYSNTTGANNVANGAYSLRYNTIGNNNVANGYFSLYENTTGGYNVANGNESLRNNTTGAFNVANGHLSLNANTTGVGNVANGSGGLMLNTTGGNNVANGNNSLRNNTTGNNNVGNGAYSLRNNTTGNNNTAYGHQSGYNTLGDGNVFLGYNAGYNEAGSDKLYIDNSSTATPLIYGDFASNLLRTNGNFEVLTSSGEFRLSDFGHLYIHNTAHSTQWELKPRSDGRFDLNYGGGGGRYFAAYPTGDIEMDGTTFYLDATTNNVGLGTTTPSATLDVEGTFQLVDGNQAMGKVLTSDASGNATWTVPAADADWTISGTNQYSGVTGNVGIGTITPTAKLDLVGSFKLTDGTQAAGRVLTSDASGNATWAVPAAGGAFSTTANVTSNAPGAYATDDFVFGSPQLNDNGNVANNRRMFFDKSKGAFRAGTVTGTQWDDANVGSSSTAMGYNTTASGVTSTAMGNTTIAFGGYSTAMGYLTTAFGDYSTAMGFGATASGDYSTAMGFNTTASSDHSTAMGYNTTASGGYSTAMGVTTTASGNYSTAMGVTTTASGFYSTAMGYGTTASGGNSTAMGTFTTAASYVETSIGSYSTSYAPLSTTAFNAADRLFTIGNGANSAARSDAMVVLKNGNVGLGTSTPTAKLDLVGSFKLTNGTQAAGRVLTSDASGNATWTVPASSGWGLTGNTGTVNGTNFVGTTDAQDLDIRTNNVIRTRITQKGQIEVLNTGNSVFIGEGAGANDNLASNRNVFVGHQSGNSNTAGGNNVANGSNSLFSNTIGNNNVANGSNSLSSNTTGGNNTANGYNSLDANTTGAFNVAYGSRSLGLNITGNNNTAYGYQSGYNALGSRNVFLGSNAGYNETGSDKLYIDNSNTATPLIYGDFASDLARVNGTLDVNGALMLSPAVALVNLTVDNQAVTVGNQSYIRLSSNNATATNRTFTLSAGLQVGQMLIIESALNSSELQEAANVNLAGTGPMPFGVGDTLTLIWNGTAWIQLSESNN